MKHHLGQRVRRQGLGTFVLALALLLASTGTQLSAVTIADSIADFSATQGLNDWSYGFFIQGGVPGTPYSAGAFQQFDVFNGGANRWEASAGLVGANNNVFLNIGSAGGHPTGIGPPTQDSIIFAIRRYTSPVAGQLLISFDLRKSNIVNPNGGGITGRIFLDGAEVFTQFIANTDGVGVQAAILQNVNIGSTIDFAIDPTGVQPTGGDGPFSARADGSIFSSTIASVPEPSAILLMGLGLVALAAHRLR